VRLELGQHGRMKLFRALGLLALVVSIGACCPCMAPPPATPSHRVGGADPNTDPAIWQVPPVAVTGNTATITIFDTGAVAGKYLTLNRILFRGLYDQAVTVLYQVQTQGSTTWSTMNNAGAGDSVPANSPAFIDYLVQGPRSRVQVVTGATGPTVSETAYGLIYTATGGRASGL
jgi:hypothetical protein